ncbi:MAG: MoaD/ThiS family protein [Sphingomicrobium sp.]
MERDLDISLFGRLADAFGPQLNVALPAACSVRQLRELLAMKYPELAELMRSSRVRACIGDSIVSDDHLIGPREQVEFFPPVSGG